MVSCRLSAPGSVNRVHMGSLEQPQCCSKSPLNYIRICSKSKALSVSGGKVICNRLASCPVNFCIPHIDFVQLKKM